MAENQPYFSGVDHTFPTSADSKLKSSTAAFFALIVILGAVLVFVPGFEPGPSAGRTVMLGVAVVYAIFMAAVTLVAWSYKPKAYRVTDQDLLIERGVAPKRIRIDSIVSVEHLSDGAMRRTWKIGGIAGLFCWHGWFTNKQLGEFYMSATRSDRRVLVRAGKQRIVLTPDSPEQFVKVLAERLRP